jgi:hypothetical protein
VGFMTVRFWFDLILIQIIMRGSFFEVMCKLKDVTQRKTMRFVNRNRVNARLNGITFEGETLYFLLSNRIPSEWPIASRCMYISMSMSMNMYMSANRSIYFRFTQQLTERYGEQSSRHQYKLFNRPFHFREMFAIGNHTFASKHTEPS